MGAAERGTSPASVRLFVAINFPEELRASLVDATAALRHAAPSVRWTPPERLHLTVKFLGEQPKESVAALAEAIAGVARRHRPMELELSAVGAFPNFRRARVVWIGVEASPRLELLYHDVEIACERLGYELEGRVFRPHVTVGRVRPGTAPLELRALADEAAEVGLAETLLVESIDLMVSEATARGARYRVLHAAPLRED